MVRLTSAKLRVRGMQQRTAGEVLKFIGVTLLATRYEFGARADLWATKARFKYMQAPAFCEPTGMPRSRFDALWSSLTFIEQAADKDNSKGSRWQLVNEFFCAINSHQAARVSPSDLICVDESRCKWYGQGGHWIVRGLPMYAAIDRKFENGCEIQDAACGRSGNMLNLSVVTTAEHHQDTAKGHEDDLLNCISVLKKLVAPWAGSKRVVCADSYFASVATAEQLLAMGFRFIGFVKTATRGYQVSTLCVLPLEERGNTSRTPTDWLTAWQTRWPCCESTKRGDTSSPRRYAHCLAGRATACGDVRWETTRSTSFWLCHPRSCWRQTTSAAPKSNATTAVGTTTCGWSTSCSHMIGPCSSTSSCWACVS